MNGVWDEGSEMVGEPISKQRATNNNTSYEESYTTIPIKDKKKTFNDFTFPKHLYNLT